MMYLKQIRFSADGEKAWPWCLPSLSGLEAFRLEAPVTVLTGENGSGKSTLMEALAIALKMPAIGRVDAHRDETLKDLQPFAHSLRLDMNLTRPKARFFMRSEDFFGFQRRLVQEMTELKQELARVEVEYKDRSAFAKGQARMAFAGSLAAYESRYGKDALNQSSHGESFLRLFQSRIVPGGLYLLDEPEAPLSPLRQLALLSMIRDMAEKQDCQFILVTHSPVLAALPGAQVLTFDTAPFSNTRYEELEAVNLLRDFLSCPERMLRQL